MTESDYIKAINDIAQKQVLTCTVYLFVLGLAGFGISLLLTNEVIPYVLCLSVACILHIGADWYRDALWQRFLRLKNERENNHC